MSKKMFYKDRLAVTISMALGATMLPGAGLMAQEQEYDAALEEVVVTGIRASLDRAVDMKRGSDGIVDAISAEDIGKFPDTNLAESMQRITGVSINRVNGEGSEITVRGLGPQFNLVTLNGRQLARTTGARSFDFQNVASEMVTGVTVTKSGDATVPAGGIGATVDLLTARPLEMSEQKATFAVKGINDTSSQEGGITPEFSGFYSDTFADGTFGVAISASVSERESGSQQGLVGTGWRSFPGTVDQNWGAGTADWGGVPQDNQVNRPGEGDIYSVPQTTQYKFEETQRTRTNGQLVLQWAPTDDITATMDYMRYENEVASQFNDVSAWYNFGPSENVWTDGPIASPLIYSESFGQNPDTGKWADLAMAGGGTANKYTSDTIGVNLEWDVNDRLALEFDAHHSEADRSPDSPWGSTFLLGTAAFIREQSTTDFTEELPALYVKGGNAVQPSDMEVTGSVFTSSRDFSEVDQFRFSGNFEINESSDIDFGISSMEVSNRSQQTVVQRNNAWGGAGPASDVDDSFFTPESIQDKFDMATGDFSEVDGIDSSDLQDVYFSFDFEKLRAAADELYGATIEDGGLVGDCGTQFCASTDYSAATDRMTTETTTSLYTQYNYESMVQVAGADMPYSVHFGLRYEDTEVDSKAAAPTYDGAVWTGDTEIGLVATGERGYIGETGNYDFVLPSLSLNLEVREDLVVRAAASESITRPDYNAIKGGTVVSSLARFGEGGAGSSGNPSLLPYESVNFDLSTEWYYGDASYASVGLFHKKVTNWISSGIIESTVFNIPDPTNGALAQEARNALGGNATAGEIRGYIQENHSDSPLVSINPDTGAMTIAGDPANDPALVFNINAPTNGDREEKIKGLELAVQHMFGDTGFGVIANYTVVDSGLEYDPYNLEDQEVLVGLSDSANLVGLYDKNGLQARLAYNWRDQFLSATGQDTGQAAPQYTEAYQQLDLNVSYELPQVEGLQVFLEGLNITDEYARVHGRDEKQVLGVYQGGARWQMGARYSF